MQALHYANKVLLRVRLAFRKLLQTVQKSVLVMIKHCLGNRVKSFLLNKRKSLRVQWKREQILFIQIAKLKTFFTLRNSPFPLTQSIKVHRRALVLLPFHRCENSPRESCNCHHLIMQRDNIHARTHDTCMDQRGYMTSGWRNLL